MSTEDEPEILSPPLHNYTIESDESQEENAYDFTFFDSDLEDLDALVKWLTALDKGSYGYTVMSNAGWNHKEFYPALYLLTSMVEELKHMQAVQ